MEFGWLQQGAGKVIAAVAVRAGHAVGTLAGGGWLPQRSCWRIAFTVVRRRRQRRAARSQRVRGAGGGA